ncbi:hypothetical protein WN55_10038 [Dufourea novaeangliae]|uniref:Uncharacterized protein n=1 Tax=Dufourea novaeangliae TaxID=178035 RepID=A0A154P8I3_DUFNO|nr:hypothetical protein WN55_10038 [Dufourea novaeangliae]
MAQSDKAFFSTVYCWRGATKSMVKAGFFSFEGNDEKFIYNIDTAVNEIGDDLPRGFKFIGNGAFAIIPETRLKVDMNAFFRGELKAFALRKKDPMLKMNVVVTEKGDRAIRLCNVLTFDENDEGFEFGGITFRMRPRMTFEEKKKMRELAKKEKSSPKKETASRSDNKKVDVKRKSTKMETRKSNRAEKAAKEEKASLNSEPRNPTLNDLVSEEMDTSQESRSPMNDGIQELEELMNSTRIASLKTVPIEENSEGSDSSDSEDENEPKATQLSRVISDLKEPSLLTITPHKLNRLSKTRYTGVVTSLKRRKGYEGLTNYCLLITSGSPIWR